MKTVGAESLTDRQELYVLSKYQSVTVPDIARELKIPYGRVYSFLRSVGLEFTRKPKVNSELKFLEDWQYKTIQEHDPEICKHFGCGKRLKSSETLYGDYCQTHSKREKIDPTLFVKDFEMKTA